MSREFLVENSYGLSNQDIMCYCPSVFAEGKHSSRSERYTYISTGEVLQALREAGFAPVKAMQSSTRTPDRLPFTKHLLRLRRVEDLGMRKPDIREVVVVNSADGTSAYNLYSGIFRVACTNGLITGDIDTRMKVYHKGDVAGQVVEGSIEIIEEGEKVMQEIEEMKHIQLSRPEQLLLAQFAHQARFDQEETIYQPEDLLRIRRNADAKNDLYTTFNVIQENVVAGGLKRRDRKGKKHTTRAIHGIDQNVKLNQMLWAMAEEFKKLKS